MVRVTLPPELERVALEQARRVGKSPQQFVLGVLESSLLPASVSEASADEWQRKLEAASVDCGTSLSDEALSSNGLYD